MNIIKKAHALTYTFDPGEVGINIPGTPGHALTKVISSVIGVMTIFGLLWFLIQIIVAGYNFISAGGDQQKIKDAQQKIQNNFIGAAVLVAAIFLLSLVGELLGIPGILNLEEIINRLSPDYLGPMPPWTP